MSQGIHTPLRFRRTLQALGALIIAFALAAIASPASAHDDLLGADPAADAEVAVLPTEIVLTFSGVLLDDAGASEVVVTDAAGASLTGGDPLVDGTRLTQPLTGNASGVVTVIWRVVSSDGHPISGEYSFTVGDSAIAPLGTETPLPGAPMNDTGMGAVWIVLGIVAAALGGALVAVLIARSRGRRED